MQNLFSQTFTTGEVAQAFFLPRQGLTDLCRRTGFEPEGFDSGWRRLTFVDVVLLHIVREHAEFMDGKEAAQLGMALRPFAKQLADTYGVRGELLFVQMDGQAPVAFAQRERVGDRPSWRVTGVESLSTMAAHIQQAAALNARLAEEARLGDDAPYDPELVIAVPWTPAGVMIDMAHAFKMAYASLTRGDNLGSDPA